MNKLNINFTNSSEKLSLKKIFGYALGGVPTTLLAGVFTLCYVDFFYDDLKLNWSLFILGQVIYMIVNALNDPFLGQLSDRTDRIKWGSRRIIYIKYGGPIWALIFVIIWFPWSYTNQILIFLQFVVSVCAFDTMLTLVVLCWMALLPEITSNIDQRNKANLIANIFMFISAIPVIIIQLLKSYGLVAFQIGNIIIAIISVFCFIVVSYTCKERPEFQKDKTFPFKKAIKKTLKTKSFLYYLGYNFTQVFKNSIGLTYLFTYLLILGNNEIALLGAFLVFVLVGFGSNYVCIKLRPKWGMKKIIVRFGILNVIGTFVAFILIINPMTEFLIWFAFIWTTFFGGYSVFNYPLMTLSIDEDELKSGSRREGMFLGMNALFTKPAESIGPIIATFILEFFGYVKNSAVQPASALFGIKILFLIIPAIATIIGLVFIYFHPIDINRSSIIKTELDKLHRQKLEKLS